MPVIDLSFVLVGNTIPLDHGYRLFSTLSPIVPALHGDRRAGVRLIRGRQTGPGVLSVDDRSRLKVPGIPPGSAETGLKVPSTGDSQALHTSYAPRYGHETLIGAAVTATGKDIDRLCASLSAAGDTLDVLSAGDWPRLLLGTLLSARWVSRAAPSRRTGCRTLMH